MTVYLILRYIALIFPLEKLSLNKSQRKVFSSGIKKFSSQYTEHHQCYSQFYTKYCWGGIFSMFAKHSALQA